MAVTDLFSLKGRTALVTGASRGLGASVALGLARSGADVMLHGHSTDPDGTRRTILGDTSARAECIIGDLADRAAADRVVSETIDRFGGLDILINNAGIIRRTPAAEFGDDLWDEVIEINLTSVFRLCRAAGRHMLARGRGKIINIASLLTFQGGVNVPAYAVSKGGIGQLTKALANEWAARGVNVNAIAPGYISTDNTSALRADAIRNRQITERIPAGRWGKAGRSCGRRDLPGVRRVELRARPRPRGRRRLDGAMSKAIGDGLWAMGHVRGAMEAGAGTSTNRQTMTRIGL